jgi:hypothetical protein
MPSFPAADAAIANRERAMHDEYDARKRRQPGLAAARQCVLVKPQYRLHDASHYSAAARAAMPLRYAGDAARSKLQLTH